MKIITGEHTGFCFGVENAVNIALKNAGEGVYTYGELIHNESVVDKLVKAGVKCIKNLEELKNLNCQKIIIRSHGVPKLEFEELKKHSKEVIDATCPFVSKIHKIVTEFSSTGYHIVIIGEASHPEVRGISGWTDGHFTVLSDESGLNMLENYDKLCFVAQTTFPVEKYKDIIKKIEKHSFKTVEIFDTICYTTYRRQIEAAKISANCNIMLVLGSRTSSNTSKLYDICKAGCVSCYLIENVAQLKNIKFNPLDTIGIVAGASTPKELIMEVKEQMSQQFEEAQSQEFIDGVEGSMVSYKEGKRFKGTVILANDAGIKVNIGGKKDGFIPKDEVNLDSEYNAADFPEGTDIEAIIISKQDADSGCVLLSKKKVDLIKEGDKVVETIRNGEVFELKVEKDTKGGLLSKLGTYTVFIPASQIKESFVKDLKIYINKTLRLTATEIDDQKHKIVASSRKVIERERKEREEIFWSHVQPDVIVSGKVKRVTKFGAFVSVDGFDCLARIVDLSWTHISAVEDVLKIGETYDFLVLSVDKDSNRVSLGYKQLQPHPFDKCIQNHPIGSIAKGKVTSIVPFGAFVEIEKGIEGLVHVSEAAHSFVKNIGEVVKIGEEIDVMILNADPANRKITLSIKAAKPEEKPEPVAVEETKETESVKEPKQGKKEKPTPKKEKEKIQTDENNEWSDETSNTPFADLLKDFKK